MKKEFMLYVRNSGDRKTALTKEEHLVFIRKCETYISELKARQQLIAAQPLLREGIVLSKSDGSWQMSPVDIRSEIQVGYYHIAANNLEEAIGIAKDNPEFEYIPGASIELRPIKTKEEETAFIYPISGQ